MIPKMSQFFLKVFESEIWKWAPKMFSQTSVVSQTQGHTRDIRVKQGYITILD